MACKRLFVAVWKCTKWLVTLLIPLMALSITCGIADGVLFALWHRNYIATNVDTWLRELKDATNDWGPSTFTFRDFMDRKNDFHLLRLNSNDWSHKLGYLLPREYSDFNTFLELDMPVNKLADLETLMLHTNSTCRDVRIPKEQWVYVSQYTFHIFSPWDLAFESVVEAGYVPSRLNETRIFYAQCSDTAGFLCGVWGVRAPTLLHFLTEDSAPQREDIPDGLTYDASSISDLRPVTVRVIELPLKNIYTGLPSDVFPGYKEQMLAIMQGDRLYEQFEPWNDFTQTTLRFEEYLDSLHERKGSFLHRLRGVDEWVTEHFVKPLGLEIVGQTAYVISSILTIGVTSNLVLRPLDWARQAFLDFFGYPKKGDQILMEESDDVWNPWADLMSMSKGMEAVLDSLRRSAEVNNGYPDGKITTSPRPGPTIDGDTHSWRS